MSSRESLQGDGPRKNVQFFEFQNTPTASHTGGVWERQGRSVRDILQSLSKDYAHILNDESLHTS